MVFAYCKEGDYIMGRKTKEKANKIAEKKHIVPYYVTETGAINHNLVSIFEDMFYEKGYMIDDFGMGSAYNMPIYLLGEIEDNFDKAVVVSFYEKEGQMLPIILFDESEIALLAEELGKAGKEEDSYNIIRKVHRELRGIK